MASVLRKPFSDAYPLFIRMADQQRFPHSFDFDDALVNAQRLADYRAKGDSDAPDFRRIGELPYLMLSYLGQPPPPELVTMFRERLERIRGYVADGSIQGEVYKNGSRIELIDAKRDMIQLRKNIKVVDGEVLPDVDLLLAFEAWTKLVATVMLEFAMTLREAAGGAN